MFLTFTCCEKSPTTADCCLREHPWLSQRCPASITWKAVTSFLVLTMHASLALASFEHFANLGILMLVLLLWYPKIVVFVIGHTPHLDC
jgi:hypothetical protein